jgi:hypothetical protein
MAGNDKSFFLFYNEDIRNREEGNKTEKIALSNLNKAGLAISAYSSEGSAVPIVSPVSAEEDLTFYPAGNVSIDESHFLLYSQKEKNYKFGKLTVR